MFYLIITDIAYAQKTLDELNDDNIKSFVEQRDSAFGWLIAIDPKDIKSIGIDGMNPAQRREYFQSEWLERTSLRAAPIVVQIQGRKEHQFIVNRFYWRRA